MAPARPEKGVVNRTMDRADTIASGDAESSPGVQPQAAACGYVVGFAIVDRAGEFIAWAEHVEVASRRFRLDPLAGGWVQCSTGNVMGYRRAKPARVAS